MSRRLRQPQLCPVASTPGLLPHPAPCQDVVFGSARIVCSDELEEHRSGDYGLFDILMAGKVNPTREPCGVDAAISLCWRCASWSVQQQVASAPPPAPPEALSVPAWPGQSALCDRIRLEQFDQMRKVYGQTGGLVEGDFLLRMLRGVEQQPISVLAKRTVNRSLLNFEWQGRMLIPMFQVPRGDLSPQPYVPETLYELVDVFDDWEIANWFAQPSNWLGGRAPAVAISVDAEAVFLAARADRFIARG